MQELLYEAPPGKPLVIVEPDMTPGEIDTQQEIEWARGMILGGLQETTRGRLAIVRGLLHLREDDRWKSDPIVAHIEHEPRWKADYLTELAAWLKDRNPNLQCGVNTMMNYMRYKLAFVDKLGLPEELVFGATEHTRRAIIKMCDWDAETKEPKRLRPKYSLDIPGVDGDLTEQMKVVAEGALALGRYSPDYFEAFQAGDGQEKIEISSVITVDRSYLLRSWRCFIKKTHEDGTQASYVVDLCREPMPFEVGDYMEGLGWSVEVEED